MRTKFGALLVAVVLALAGCTDGGPSPSPAPSSAAAGDGPTDEGTFDVSTVAPTPPPGPGAPATPADLLTYVRAGASVDLAAYTADEPDYPMSFVSPSNNIKCGFDLGFVGCGIVGYSWAPFPEPTPCENDWIPNSVSASEQGVWRGECRGDPSIWAFATKVLPYGSTISNGSIACRSESSFMACANLATGNGFVIARAFYTLYGTVMS